jgi:DNA-binding NarL/FixJ family response regulator
MAEMKDRKISEREIEVLYFIAKGFDYNQIAKELSVSPATVRKHTENLYKKLDVHNKIEAIQKGIKAQLIRI